MRAVRLLALVGALANAGFLMGASNTDPGGWGWYLVSLALVIAFGAAPFLFAVQAMRVRQGWAFMVLSAGVVGAVTFAVVSYVRALQSVHQDGIVFAAVPMVQIMIIGATLAAIDAWAWWRARNTTSVTPQG